MLHGKHLATGHPRPAAVVLVAGVERGIIVTEGRRWLLLVEAAEACTEGPVGTVRHMARLLSRFLAEHPEAGGRPWPFGDLPATETVVAALRYLGHEVRFGDASATTTAVRVRLRDAGSVASLDRRMVARIQHYLDPEDPLTVAALYRSSVPGRREEPWLLRGVLERLTATGHLELVDGQPPEVWRIANVASSSSAL